MANLIVGDEDCKYRTIAGCFTTPTLKLTLHNKWMALGGLLGVEEAKLDTLRRSILLEKVDPTEALVQILIEWRSSESRNAKLEKLIGFAEEIDFKDAAVNLRKKFGVESNKKKDKQESTNVNFDMQAAMDYILSKNPFEVKVDRPVNPMTFTDYYCLPATGKGLALIINIVEFQNTDLKQRHGGEKDLEYMSELWAQLGYELFPKIKSQWEKSSWEKSEIVQVLEQFKERIAKSKPKSIVVFIGSHGCHQKIYTSDKPHNHDCVSLHLYKDIVSIFGESTCPILKGRPKIFIVNTCQAFDGIDNYSNEFSETSLVWTAQVEGAKAYRDTEKGSWFTISIAYILMKYAHERPLQDMCNMVWQLMNEIMPKIFKKQVPVSYSILMEKLYFTLDP